MDRKSTSTLAGAVLLSFVLSLGLKPTPGGGTAAVNYASPLHAGAPGALQAGTVSTLNKRRNLPPHSEDEVKELAEQWYKPRINDLIASSCEGGEKCPRNQSDYIIAIVPDPVHTHLALQFDRAIEAIEEAMQDRGFVFAHAILPWESKTHPETDDYENRLEAEWFTAAREDFPALMVFRGDSKHPGERRFVWMVAETPTGGIQTSQFQKAAAWIPWPPNAETGSSKKWRTGKSTDPVLRILGPTYSGSLFSLTQLLTCSSAAACYPGVSIYSGTVTSRSEILAFTKQEHNLNMRFVSFQESDEVMIERFVEFLTGDGYGSADDEKANKDEKDQKDKKVTEHKKDFRNYKKGRIAILSEDETSYGGLEITAGRKPAEDGDDDRILKLYFPREISQLRAAYQDSSVGGSGNDAHNPGRETLPSNFSVPGSDDDTVALFSVKQMPLSQESIMLSIVSELRKHEVEFVILRATDPMDSLFLSEYLSSEFPQGRIVTIGADMLYRREADDPRLHGLLALSTYSLAPAGNHNFVSYECGHVERIFPSSDAVGNYNAMRSLLNEPAPASGTFPADDVCTKEPTKPDLICRHKLSQPGPTNPLQLYQYGWVREQCRECDYPQYFPIAETDAGCDYCAPPVRLLALGRDQYWPLASLGPFRGQQMASQLPHVSGQVHGKVKAVEIPNSWRVVQLFAIAMGLGFSGCLWFSSIRSKTQMVAKFAPAMPDSRASLILIGGQCLILIMLILLWPSWHGLESWHSLGSWYEMPLKYPVDVLLVATVILVFVITIVEWTSRYLLSNQPGAEPESWWNSLKKWPLFAAFLIISVIFACKVFLDTRPENAVFGQRYSIVRAVQLTSGLSFVMPWFFFLIAVLWWGDHITVGFALVDERQPRLPRGMSHPNAQRLLEKNFKKGLEPVYHLAGGSNLYWLAPAVFIVSYWFLGDPSHPIMTLESPGLERFLIIFLAVAVAWLIRATLKSWELWLGARNLLVALDSLPLRRGFLKIKGFSWKPIWRLGVGSLEEFQRNFSRKKEALDWAINTVPLHNVEVEKEIKAVRRLAKAAERPRYRNRWRRRELERRLVRRVSRIQTAIADAAGAALDYLAWSWSMQKNEAGSLTGREAGPDPKVSACERFVCLTYIDFLLVVLVRMRTLVVAIAGMYVLILIGITQYPFEPRGAIQVTLVLLLVFVVVVVGTVFAQIFRDTTLSNITETTPGELGRDFWVLMAGFVALPLFSLLASQFPSVNRFFYSWLQPAIQALNR